MRLRKAANGQMCTLGIPGVCSRDRATVVLAHLPRGLGTGMARKCPDIIGAWACHACHDELDGRTRHLFPDDVDSRVAALAMYELMGLKRTLAQLVERKLI